MRSKTILSLIIIFSSLLFSACNKNKPVPVQEYRGEDYVVESSKFPGFTSSKPKKIAEKNKEEVHASVKEYFLKEYKTEVTVNKIVNALDRVFVFVESTKKPYFYSAAILPVDTDNNELQTKRIHSEQNEVESAIVSGLYRMAYEEEFDHLDSLLKEIVSDFPVVGIHPEVIQNTRGNNYETPHYYLKVYFEPLFDAYLKKPDLTAKEIRNLLDKEKINNDNDDIPVGIVIRLHMEEENLEPNEEIYDKIYEWIKEAENLPAGDYSFKLYDNSINPARARGSDHNSIDKTGKRIKKR